MPFIQPRLSSKDVESIWTEAATEVTGAAKMRKGRGGYSVSCNTCSPRLPDMHGLTHDAAERMVGTHNSLHHSRTASKVAWRPSEGEYGPFTYEDNKKLDEEYDTDELSPLHRSNRFPKEYHAETGRNPHGHKIAFTHDEIDWTGIEPGDPECASYRPSDLEETRRIIRREDDRRKTPRDTPDRRQASKVGYSTDDELKGLCATCKSPLNSFSKTVDGKSFCTQTCAESYQDRKSASRKTAVENWDAIMQSPELKAVWPQVRNLASEIISSRQPQDEDGAIYGISSSDINHTVFGYAQRYWNGTTLNVGGMIREMMDEADNG
jgi:hypothetical protein